MLANSTTALVIGLLRDFVPSGTGLPGHSIRASPCGAASSGCVGSGHSSPTIGPTAGRWASWNGVNMNVALWTAQGLLAFVFLI